MSEELARIHTPAAEVSEEALKRAEELIEEEEGVQNKFSGRMAAFITAVAVLMSLYHLYAAYYIVRTEALRATHVAFVLFLSFLIFPLAKRFRHRVMPWDWVAALLGVAVCAYLISQGDEFFDRSIVPNALDVFFGVALIVLVLEAMRLDKKYRSGIRFVLLESVGRARIVEDVPEATIRETLERL